MKLNGRDVPRIYFQSTLSAGEIVQLDSDTLHYLRDVLRLKPNEWFYAFDGKGGEYVSRVVEFSKKHGSIELVEWHDVNRESNQDITLVQGIARGEKMDWIIQKSVELGVFAIQPVITEHSNVRLSRDRWEHKLIHWQRIAEQASAQSGRTRVPVVHFPIELSDALSNSAHPSHFDQTWVLAPESKSRHQFTDTPQTIAIYVGPEGGFSLSEMTAFREANVSSWSLGDRILRTETASLVALSVLQYRVGK